MMNFRGFASASPQTPYAPTWNFQIGTNNCANIDLLELSSLFLSKEEEIKNLPFIKNKQGNCQDGFTGLGEESTTSRFYFYNVLSWNNPEIDKLRYHIRKNLVTYNTNCGNHTPNELYIQCWINILRKGQNFKPHFHTNAPFCYLSGHFNVQTENTSTVYMSPINQLNKPEVIDIKNINGDMSLFPSYIFHYTTPHNSDKPRITVAFDILYQPVTNNWIRL